jgi:hypothetical protein
VLLHSPFALRTSNFFPKEERRHFWRRSINWIIERYATGLMVLLTGTVTTGFTLSSRWATDRFLGREKMKFEVRMTN